MALVSTQPVTEMGGGGGERRPVRKADNLTTFMCRLSWKLGALTRWNLQALSKACTGITFPLPFPLEGTILTRTKNSLCLILWFCLVVPPFRKQFAVLCNVKSFSCYLCFTLCLLCRCLPSSIKVVRTCMGTWKHSYTAMEWKVETCAYFVRVQFFLFRCSGKL